MKYLKFYSGKAVKPSTLYTLNWKKHTTNDNEWYKKWKQIKVILGFRMKQLNNVNLQYMQQRLFENTTF